MELLKKEIAEERKAKIGFEALLKKAEENMNNLQIEIANIVG